MIICLILAITCAGIGALKLLEGVSISMIIYFIVAAVFLVIYLAGLIEKKRDAR